MTKSNPEITDLTVCRAFFAAWVFIYHVDLHANFSPHLGLAQDLIRRGYMGVDGFFILSGLVLARVHQEMAVPSISGILRFWGKRLARIYPVHLATILILLGLITIGTAAGLTPRDPTRFGLVPLLQNLTLIHGWGFSDQLAWNYPSWSVSTEWAGYLLFPIFIFCICYWVPLISGQIVILCIPILGIIAFLSGNGLNITSGTVLLRFIPEFMMGISTARLVPVAADRMPSFVLALIGMGIAGLGALFGHDLITVVGFWLVLASLAMHADAERPPIFGKARILRPLGLLSYSFYMSFAISELLLAQLFRHLAWDPSSNKFIYSAAMTLLTFLLATSLYFIVEKPSRRYAERWLPGAKPPLKKQPLAVIRKHG